MGSIPFISTMLVGSKQLTVGSIMLLLLIETSISFAQAKVDDPAFNLMLKSLLSHSVPEISVKDVPKDAGAIFLDSRERNEFDVSHIRRAKYVGYNEFTLDSLKKIPHDKPIIVYCSVGSRSEKVSEKLIAAGYTDVKNLYGGIFEWVNEGYPVYDNEGHPTKKVHAYNHTWGIWLKKGEKIY